jgi:elongation factor P
MIRDRRVVRTIFAPSVQLESVTLETKDAKLLSREDGNCLFQGLENDQQITVSEKIPGKVLNYIPIGTKAALHYYDGSLLEISFPNTIALLVKQIIDNKALLETGASIKVPDFVKAGDTIIVNTADGAFLYIV